MYTRFPSTVLGPMGCKDNTHGHRSVMSTVQEIGGTVSRKVGTY